MGDREGERSRAVIVRTTAIIRAKGECERCHAPVAFTMAGVVVTLRCCQVHHKTYVRFGGDELDSDLEVLCTYCHRAHHSKDMKRRIA